MDPATLATAAVAVLSPYLKKVAEKAAEKVGDLAVEATEKLFGFLKGKLGGRPAAAEALADVEKAPADADALGALRVQLRKLAEADEEFRTELAKRLADPALAAAVRATQTSTVIGDNNKGAQVAGNSNVVKF